MTKKKTNEGVFIPSRQELESIARLLLPEVQAYYDSEKGQKEFKNWCNSHEKTIEE